MKPPVGHAGALQREQGRSAGAVQIRAGTEALKAGSWVQARDAFQAALALEETAEAFEGLGKAAWWLNDAARLFEAREQAYRRYRLQDDRRSAARLAIALAEDSLYFRGERAVAEGWHSRAHDLLEGLDVTPEHGWLRLSEGDFAMTIEANPAVASMCAAEALAIGQTLGIDDIQVLAQALAGAARVAEGNVAEGMSTLGGAVTAALSGEIEDPVAIGYSCCYMLSACERVHDFDRALQWCGRVKAFSERVRYDALLAVCRTKHASVLIGRGRWDEAENELQTAARLLLASRPALHGDALVRLAGLRRRQGRFDEAVALLTQAGNHPSAVLERAALELDRGQAALALQLAERFLRRVPEQNKLERLTGLEISVRAHLTLGNHALAAAAAQELGRVASDGSAGAFVAVSKLSEGLLAAAAGDLEKARGALEDAVDLLSRHGAVFDVAQSRIELARVLRASGQPETALAEAREALATLDSLGAAGKAYAAASLVRELSARSERRPPRQPGGLSGREVEVLRLVAQGLSNTRIASRLNVSEFTVKRHVQNILTKLDLPTRAAASAYAVRQGLL